MKSLAIAVALLLSPMAFATVVEFNDWVYNSSDEIDWFVTIDDESNADMFTFNVGINPGSSVLGDITGFGFSTDLGYTVPDDLTNFSAFAFSNCSGNCNWNGTGINPDYSFSVGDSGATDYVTSFSFGLPDLGVTLDANTFSLVAIRAQTVGSASENIDSRGGSVKDYSGGGMTRHSVPELNASGASTALAFIIFLIAAGLERRKKSPV